MGAKFWRRESRKDLQEKHGPREDRGNKETSNLQIVSCSACLGCGRGERFHPCIQKAWMTAFYVPGAIPGTGDTMAAKAELVPAFVKLMCSPAEGWGGINPPQKKKNTLMNMTLQTKRTVLKESSTRIAPRNQSNLGRQEVFLST